MRDGEAARERGEVLDRVSDLTDKLDHARLRGTPGVLHLCDLFTDAALDGLGIGDRQVEGGRHCIGGRVAAGADGADELGSSRLVDDHDCETRPRSRRLPRVGPTRRGRRSRAPVRTR